VIDFDGSPALARSDDPGGDAVQPQPTARDVAQMLMSIDHVGRVVDRRTGRASSPEIERWIARNRAGCLDAYRDVLGAAGRGDLFDGRLLHAFEVEQECRELVYAARFLPRWRYAPMAALEGRLR
jgi:maltokinase